jgi:hypothetical protein
MKVRARALAATLAVAAAWALVVAAEASAVVYWTNTGNLAIGDSLGRANLDGTTVTEPFVDTNEAPCGIAVDDEYVYWTHRGEFPAGYVGRATLDGTEVEPEFIATESAPCGVAVNDTHIFWANWQNGSSQGNSIGRANIDGSSPNQAFIDNAAVSGSVCGVDVDANFIYWGSRQSPGDIGRAPIGGGAADTDFIDEANFSCDVAVNATHVYWAEVSQFFGSGSVGRATIDGSSGNAEFIPNSSGVETPCGIDVDAGHVYWGDLNALIEPGPDGIGRAELDGSPVQPDFIPTAAPTCGVAVDASPIPRPVCEDQELDVQAGEEIDVQLECSGQGTLTHEVVTPPAEGTLGPLNAATGEVSYAGGAEGTFAIVHRAANAGGASGEATVTLNVALSNDFRIVGVEKNARRGTAKLEVDVPGAGRLALSGKGLKRGRKEPGGTGEVELPVRPKGAAKRKLREAGAARVRANVRYTPMGGEAKTKTKRIRLVKR